MKQEIEGTLLRVFVGENHQHEGRPIYELLVEEACDRGLAGATVLRGLMGFGAHHRVHTAKILRLTENMPVIVEIVDTKEHIEGFLAYVDTILLEGFMTTETVKIFAYRAEQADSK